MVFLVGEIAGKNNKLALFTHKRICTEENSIGQYRLDQMIACQSFSTEGYSEERDNGVQVLQQSIRTFLEENYYNRGLEDIIGGCFAITAPVESGEATINRPTFKTTLTKQDFKETLPYKTVPVALINDMEAIGYSIFLGDGEKRLQSLCHDQHKPISTAPRAFMLVSTGLGQALWHWEGDATRGEFRFIPSEGGHGDFADPTPEKKLSQYLENIKRQEGDDSPISYEYVLSSHGLFRIYQFLRDQSSSNYTQEAIDLMESAFTQSIDQNQKDPFEVLLEEATQPNPNPLSKDALDLFISIWGAEAGNLALRCKASGGIYVGCSLSIPIDKLRDGIFQNAFINKEGNFSDYNSCIPVKVFNNPDMALWGAARYALHKAFITRGRSAINREKDNRSN